MERPFEERRKKGTVAENLVIRWLVQRGNTVLPAYDTDGSERKGPRLITPGGKLVLPDALVYGRSGVFWAEIKRKDGFSWHRRTGQWVTRVNLHYYADYCAIDAAGPWDVWLFFLQEGKEDPIKQIGGPAGLYCAPLKYLRSHEHHRFANVGEHGGVFWEESVLRYAWFPLGEVTGASTGQVDVVQSPAWKDVDENDFVPCKESL